MRPYSALFANYQENMVKRMKGCLFNLDFVDRIFYKCHKTKHTKHILFNDKT